MATVDLVFAAGTATPDLVFGGGGAEPSVLLLSMAATAPAAVFAGVLKTGAWPVAAPLVRAPIGTPVAITAVACLASMATAPAAIPGLALAYDNAVNRGPALSAGLPWQDAAARTHACRLVQAATRSGETSARTSMGRVITRVVIRPEIWQVMGRHASAAGALRWQSSRAREAAGREAFRQLSRHRRPALAAPFAAASGTPQAVGSAWIEIFRRARPRLALAWESGSPLGRACVMAFHVGLPARLTRPMRWHDARQPPPGKSPGAVDPPGPGAHYLPSTALRFDDSWPASLQLVFGRVHVVRPRARVIIPILRAYIVVNEVTLLRTAGAVPLPVLALSLSIDVESWVWGWQASLPATSLEAVLPSAPGDPVALEARVNGVDFLLLAEKVTRDRRFAQARITVSGRGIAAELGAPYAPTVSRHNSGDLTAQQLMVEALTENGVGLGWSVDWQLTDWLVPAGAWSHYGTHIEAVSRIAEAAGGYVQASRNGPTLHILPRYPVAPWDWSGVSPDFALPAAATTREAVEWLEKPAYNAVYLSGEGAGILAQVQRAGTAGDRPAPMVTDALNTHADAARQRGLAILADTGRQQRLTLDTPILPGVGIYPVGSFVQFSDGPESRLGLVRSLTLNAAWPVVRQSLEIECHG